MKSFRDVLQIAVKAKVEPPSKLSCGCVEYAPNQGWTPPHDCCACWDARWVRLRFVHVQRPASEQKTPCLKCCR